MKHIFFFFVVLIFFGCRKKCDRPSSYFLDVPLSISPSDAILHIGDTLHIRMHVDNDNIYDSEGDEVVKVTDFDPNASFFLAKIDTYPEGEGLKLNDVIISDQYEAPYVPFSKRYSGGHLFLDIIQENNYSTIEFDIILKETGNYMFLAHSSIYKNSGDIIIEERCNYNAGTIGTKWIINQNMINEDILNDSLRDNIDLYWSRNQGDKFYSDPYFFRVE